MVDGAHVGFSLDQARLRPETPQKTDGEIKALLKSSGVWNEAFGANKHKILANLGASTTEG